MYIPSSYATALGFMFVTMLCWGSWANTQKLGRSWRFELFYWDYTIGVALTSLAFLLILGNAGPGESALSGLWQASGMAFSNAFFAGIVFNLANLLLVASISYAGMAVAFPIAIGIALVEGTLLSYIVDPQGNVTWLVSGMLAILMAIVLDALAYRKLPRHSFSVQKGILISALSGILMGLFYPLLAKSMHGEGSMNSYAANFVFSIGILLANIPMNLYLMRRPISGTPLSLADYRKGSKFLHGLGIAGGVIWGVGTTLNLIAANVAGPAIAYAFGQCATMVAAIWGVFIWREFKEAQNVRWILFLMFVAYGLGIYLIGYAHHA